MERNKATRPDDGSTGTILVVDDDPVQRRIVESALGRFGYATLLADAGEGGLAMLDRAGRGEVSAVLLDLMMPGIGGLDVLERMRERGIDVPVIVLTSQGGIDTVVAAMRAGAFDFLVKPVSPEKLRAAVAGALRLGAATSQARGRRPEKAGALSFKDIVTRSPTMERVLRLGRKAAASGIPILIEGESGTGKELVARAIQGTGERRSKPFVTVNCGAIPENLVESILFGHEKGAFTGATEKHVGKFTEANGGTLFLDEIGDLPLAVQVKLLRAVQEGEVDPVGARQPQRVDIRVISATHRDLIQQVRDGAFREDLFYRLNVFPIVVPPLRERREDIPLLVDHFIRRIAAREKIQKPISVDPKVLALLAAYDWPGNIRQLENAIFRAVVLCEGASLSLEDFPQIRAQVEGVRAFDVEQPAATIPETPPAPPQARADTVVDRPERTPFGALKVLDDGDNVRPLAEIEFEMICFAIKHYGGQMSEVARRLGIGRSTLYRKLKEYGIDAETGHPTADTAV